LAKGRAEDDAGDRSPALGRVPSNAVQFSFEILGGSALGRRVSRVGAVTKFSWHGPSVRERIGPRNKARCKVRTADNFALKVGGFRAHGAGSDAAGSDGAGSDGAGSVAASHRGVCPAQGRRGGWAQLCVPTAAQRFPRFFQVSCAFLLLSACGRSAPAPGGEPKPAAAKVCPAGYSVDPPRGALEPGIRAFRDRKYAQAESAFAELARQFPESATTRVWQADALLFDRELESRLAAERALPIYEAAGTLHDAGCKLPRRPRYYHLMDGAYARLRLAQGASGYDPEHLARALDFLAIAMHEFPTSAEVPYTEARAKCAVAQGSASPDVALAALTECQHKFADALRLAGQLQRPRFLRTHRSMQDWIVRSRTQSEFGPLRASPSYARIVDEALEASPLPIALTPAESP
jgi:hypothetical protein